MTTSPVTAARPWDEIPAGAADLRLVVSDMDGTLLTPDGELPDGFWELMSALRERGIAFVPASGRQLATLRAMFDPAGITSYIAENGTLVVHDGEVVETTPVGENTTREVIELVRALNADGAGLGLVRCGIEGACVESDEAHFLAEARTYYHRLDVVPDLAAVEGPTLKLAVYERTDAEAAAPAFDRFTETEQVVISGKHWIDVMNPAVGKGRGVRALQAALDVTPAQTAVFGDYLNDAGLYATADWSFAMRDAHPGIAELARYIAPGHDERGVLQVLERLLGLAR